MCISLCSHAVFTNLQLFWLISLSIGSARKVFPSKREMIKEKFLLWDSSRLDLPSWWDFCKLLYLLEAVQAHLSYLTTMFHQCRWHQSLIHMQGLPYHLRTINVDLLQFELIGRLCLIVYYWASYSQYYLKKHPTRIRFYLGSVYQNFCLTHFTTKMCGW